MFDNSPTLQSLCWTMVHSLWQGLILALLAALVVMATRRTSAALRYNLLAFLGALFIVVMAFTFYLTFQNYHQPATSTITGLEHHQSFSPVLVTYHDMAGTKQPVLTEQSGPSVIASVAGFFDQNAPYIVALWFIVFAYKCLRLFRGLRQIHYLRHYRVSAVSPEWNNRLGELKQLLQANGRVRLLESALVKAPVVVGFFKPVILLPVGLLANMPAAQVEAMLLHELAHIRRKDYLANLVQGFGEVVLFFNPGFMWVSSLIKTERENCCDDLAVSVTQSKTDLVKALIFSQEYTRGSNRLALSFGNKKTALLDRAKRILHNHNQSLNNMEKTFLSLCIVSGLCVTFAFSDKTKQEKPVSHQPVISSNTNVDTTPLENPGLAPVDEDKDNYIGKNFQNGTALHYFVQHNGYNQPVYVFKHDNTVYQVTGDIRELKVNGEIIPQENWGKYMPVVQELMQKHRNGLEFMPDDSLVAPLPPVPPVPPLAPIPPVAPVPPVPPTPPAWAHYYSYVSKYLGDSYSSKEDSLRKKEIEAAQKRMEAQMKKLAEEMRQMDKEMAEADKEMNSADRERAKSDIEMKKAEIEMKKAEMEMEKANMEMERAEREMQKAELALEKANATAYPFEQINSEIMKELGLSTKKVASYKLDRETLIVNGKIQPAELHERLSKKYLKGKIKKIYYEYTTKNGKSKTTLTGLEVGD